MKKKINYKAFAKMYRELGEYRIVDDGKHKYIIQRKSEYTNTWTPISLICKCDTLDDCKELIFRFRYRRIKDMRSKLKKPKIVYTHP